MHIRSSGATDPGRVRKNNEDAFAADDRLGLYAVADGVGGLDAGEVASRTVIDALQDVISGLRSGKDATPPYGIARGEEQEITALRHAITLANRQICDAVESDPARKGMGSTVTAVLVGAKTAFLAHVGDSRAYRLRRRSLKQITNDHSVVAEQVRKGTLTPEQARTSSYRNVITRAVGIGRDIAVDVAAVPLAPDDTYLLCTDGLTDMLTDADIAAVLRRTDPAGAVRELVESANSRGGVDNITAVVFRITG